MAISQHYIASLFPFLEGTPNLAFYVYFESQVWQKWHSLTHKGLEDDGGKFSHLHCASKEGYEILQQQWIHFIVYYYILSCVERLPQIWQVGCNLGVDLNKNGMM